MTSDPAIRDRVEELIAEAKITLEAIRSLAPSNVKDPFTNPATLARAVTVGILDAPQLLNNPFARGKIVSRIDGRGACVAVEPDSGEPISEKERVAKLSI